MQEGVNKWQKGGGRGCKEGWPGMFHKELRWGRQGRESQGWKIEVYSKEKECAKKDGDYGSTWSKEIYIDKQ